jgi:tRNA threonylcarbamoyladenosine biosynthesis protein TsaB
MNILAFDTCFDACSVCVAELRDSVVMELASARERFETGHAERLVPMIDEVMARAGMTMEDLDRLAVTVGPGTFTGTRIGIAAARALALATGVAVVGTSSLAVMAHAAAREIGARPPEEIMAVAVDARRGEVYAQLFAAGGIVPRSQPMLLAIEDAARLGGDGSMLVVGSAAQAVADAAAAAGPRVTAKLPGLLPDAASLAQLAVDLLPAEGPLAPLYLRAPDAKPQDGKSLARAGR